jgi:hypothetical protein
MKWRQLLDVTAMSLTFGFSGVWLLAKLFNARLLFLDLLFCVSPYLMIHAVASAPTS